MQIYDIIMLTVLVGATVLGLWKGVVWQIASMASIFLSFFVAMHFREPVAKLIQAAPPWNKFLAMLALYIGCSLAIWILFRLVSDFLDRIKLKEFDRQLGAVLGLAKGVVLCVVITMFAATLLTQEQRDEVINSKSGYCAAWLLYQAHDVMPAEVHDVIHPYMHP
ncbi:MAG: membrane protein required for colicin V production, partial [Pirellulaceae bacterium]